MLIGADGIDSLVRRTLWGDEPKREHRLHIFGGFTFAEVEGTVPNLHRAAQPHHPGQLDVDPEQGPGRTPVVGPDRHGPGCGGPRGTQGGGHRARRRLPGAAPGAGRRDGPGKRAALGAARPDAAEAVGEGPDHLCGDAAHATSPYAAYGAGMSIEDGYFFGRALRGVDLTDLAAVQQALQSYEDPRKPHTAKQVNMARMLGKVFHHAPAPLRPVRDFVFDHTPFLQKMAGDSNPREINQQLSLITD